MPLTVEADAVGWGEYVEQVLVKCLRAGSQPATAGQDKRRRRPATLAPIFGGHGHRRTSGDKRKGLTEAGYARLLHVAHQPPGGPIVLIWDDLNTHVSRAMRKLAAATTG
jgi:hypothetical protein